MKIGFFCYDNAGGDAMKILAETARAMGHEAVLFPKQVAGLAKERGQELMDLDAMVTGLSSFETEQELKFADFCLKFQTSWFVFEDVPGACLRPKAKDWAHLTKMVFLAHPSGKNAARDFGYNESIYLGPPPQWRKEYLGIMDAKSKNTRVTMSKSIGAGSPIPVQESDFLIGAIGGKEWKENNRAVEMLVGDIRGVHRAVIAFSEHPGEKPKQKDGESDADFAPKLAEYECFMQERRNLLKGVWSVVSPPPPEKPYNGAQVTGSANLMFFFSASNVQIGAAFAKVPNISLDDEGFQKRMIAQTGRPEWFVNQLGGAYVVRSGDKLAEAIRLLHMSDIAKAHLREMHEADFPVPKDWSDLAAEHTEHKIIRFLERVVTA